MDLQDVPDARILASRRQIPIPDSAFTDDEPATKREHGMPGSYILLVEDDPEIGQTICDVLDEEGYVVKWFQRGDLALDFLTADFIASQRESLDEILLNYTNDDEPPKAKPDKPRVPSLILIDLVLPVVNGWELSKIIQRRESLRNVPVMVMSADPRIADYREDMVRLHGVEIDPVAMFKKPFSLTIFINAVRKIAGPPPPRTM